MNGAQQASSNIHVIFYSFFVTSLCMLNKEYVNIKEKKKKRNDIYFFHQILFFLYSKLTNNKEIIY